MINKLSKLLKGEEIQKYFFNTSWMMGEKIFTMGIAMVVSIFVARYLGPEDYGILSYAISITSLFAIATHMGLSGLAVRELVNNPDDHEELMGTIYGIKLLAALFAMAGFLVFLHYSGDSSEIEFWVLLIVSGTILLKPFEVFDFWFQAKVKAKYSSIVRVISTIILSVLKIGLVVWGAQLLLFAGAYLFQALLLGILFIIFFKRKARIPLISWRFNFSRAKLLLSQGWMIMAGAIFGMVYLKIDQVMLRWLLDAKEVGVYSVASQLSEAWYFIPRMIVASLFPKLLELKKKNEAQFKKRLQQLLDLLFGIALSLALIVTFISQPVIDFLYGTEFEKAALILSIHIWAGVFIFMRSAFSKWILVEDAIVFSMITQGAGALANIVLNIILIPLYGGLGAAIATILSYAVASYFILLLFKKSRPIFWMMTKSLIAPIRYSSQIFSK
ncbi:MAG: flippase [Candidatus Paceibacterota bacterium]